MTQRRLGADQATKWKSGKVGSENKGVNEDMSKRVIGVSILIACAALVAMPVVMGHGNKAGSATAKIGSGDVKVDFVGPAANGRTVMDLIRPGSYWRMGADQATTLTTDVDLKIGDSIVPKGSYKLVAHFDEEKNWSLVVAEDVGRGSVPTKVVAKTAGTIGELSESIENMTITLEASGTSGKFVLDWGTSRLVAEFAAA